MIDRALPPILLCTLGEIVIPCLLSVCFDDAMHGIYASHFVKTRFRVNSSDIYFGRKPYTLCLQNMKHIPHALHHQNKLTKGMGWWSPLECFPMSQRDSAHLFQAKPKRLLTIRINYPSFTYYTEAFLQLHVKCDKACHWLCEPRAHVVTSNFRTASLNPKTASCTQFQLVCLFIGNPFQ